MSYQLNTTCNSLLKYRHATSLFYSDVNSLGNRLYIPPWGWSCTLVSTPNVKPPPPREGYNYYIYTLLMSNLKQ